jgi:GT2 family glycosyltransferase/spore maturation protein CgeB
MSDPGDGESLLRLERRIAELMQELAGREAAAAAGEIELIALRGEAADADRQARTLQARLRRAEERRAAVVRERDGALEEAERRAVEVQRLEVQRAEVERQLAKLLHDLEAAQQRERRTASDYRGRVRELEQLVSTLALGLAGTKADVERAADSRAWRWGHGMTKALRALTGRRRVTKGALARALQRIEQIEASTSALPSAAAPPTALPSAASARRTWEADKREEGERAADRIALAVEIRKRLGPVPQLASWPPVSIVVPTRDGLEHVERLVQGLEERTDYPQLELILVDNCSGDGTTEFLAGANTRFPIVAIANAEPASFSDSNRQGAERASHDLLLFLNNDVEPFEPGWLRELVAAQAQDGVAAAGATLLRSEAGNDPEMRDRTVQHRSIKFAVVADGVRPFNSGDGEDLFEAGFGIEDRCAAVTAACLLVDRARFEAVGGFSNGYRFGTEDVDLGLKLARQGEALVASGRSILYHDESASQDAEGGDFKSSNRLVNRRLFLERWGPAVRRHYRLGRLTRDPFWTDGAGPRAAITVTSLDSGDGWGDWYTAHELGDALAELGWCIDYVERKGDAWYELPADLDYAISLMDPFDLRRLPGHVTAIAWVRNWTERWLERPWLERADVVLASSGRSVELIERASGRRPVLFPLATNPSRFAPDRAEPGRAADCVFTGNRWGEDREIQAALRSRRGARLDVYGKGWDDVPEVARCARGSAPYEELPAIYASARLVLDDTSGPTLPYGAVNSRVFDALACGTLAITNCEAGVRELFGEEFPTWRSPEDLRAKVDALLGDDEQQAELAKRFRAEVLRHHTYAHRARRLVEVLREHEEKLSFCLKIGAPSWQEADRWGDLHFARAAERELRRRGHRCLIQVLDEWEDAEGLDYDVALVIRGLSRYHVKPGQLNVLWNISHPDELSGEECDGYDLVCVASERFAETLRGRTETPVVVLEQATDPALFFPDPVPEYEHDLVYVANSRGVLRPIVRDLLPTDLDLAIYGANWEGLIDTRHVVAEHIPNDELRKVYSSAKVVLCDHWDDMREHGFVSNRVYDALACGATIVSDEVAGLRERFGNAVVTYRDADELRREIDRLLAGQHRPRAEMAVETFGQRVDRLLGAIAEVSYSPSLLPAGALVAE